MKRMIIILVILALGGFGAFRAAQVISARKEEPKRQATSPAPLVEVASVIQGLVEEKISRAGDIMPNTQVTIYSKVQGWVDKINVREGDLVKAGDILVTLDSREAQAAVAQLAQAVQTFINGYNASIFSDPQTGNQYNIKVRAREEDRRSLSDLGQIFIYHAQGKPIPLDNVATIKLGAGPIQIERKYQQRIIHVTANTFGRDLGSVAAEIEARINKLPIPPNFKINMGGAVESQRESFISLLGAFVLAVILVYMVLASRFKSLIDPFIIMFSVPLGIIGVLWALFLTETNLSVTSFMGVIMMAGIVVSNGILLLDYTNRLRSRGLELKEAIIQGGRTRLRPILMTTLSTILGLTPMAIGLGEGAESNAPMAIAVIGGLIVSTCLTLVFIPTLYAIFETRIKRKFIAEGNEQI